MYTALRNLTNSKTRELVKKGGKIDLSHLDKETIAMLVERGVVKKEKPRKDVKNGSN